MDWSDIGRTLAASGLKVLGGALGGPAGLAAGALVGRALGLQDSSSPDAVKAAIDADPTGALAKLRALEQDRAHEIALLDLRAQMQSLREVHKTARVEIASKDSFVRRMRALGLLFLYVIVGMQVATVCYLAITKPEDLEYIGDAFAALVVPLSILCTVLGLYIPLRTREKMADAGFVPTGGILGTLIGSSSRKEAKE